MGYLGAFAYTVLVWQVARAKRNHAPFRLCTVLINHLVRPRLPAARRSAEFMLGKSFRFRSVVSSLRERFLQRAGGGARRRSIRAPRRAQSDPRWVVAPIGHGPGPGFCAVRGPELRRDRVHLLPTHRAPLLHLCSFICIRGQRANAWRCHALAWGGLALRC